MPMTIVSGDKVFAVKPPATIDFKSNNPLARLMSLWNRSICRPSVSTTCSTRCNICCPSTFWSCTALRVIRGTVADPQQQDNKEDFQKQNIKDFSCTDARIARGWATTRGDSNAGDWTGPFLFLSYRAGPDSKLSHTAGHSLGASIRVFARIGSGTGARLDVPYNPETDRYELEIWGYGGTDLRGKLGPKGQAAFDRGGLIGNPALVPGSYTRFCA